MNIGITGANGFLGKFLVDALRTSNVTLIQFDKSKHNLNNYTSLINFVKKCDVIIHLAAINRGDDEDFIEVNSSGTLNLAACIGNYSPKTKLIFASTFQVYNIQNTYSFSKKIAEDGIIFFSKKYNFPAIILRISNIYGPNAKPRYNSVIATLVDQIMHDEKLTINGTGKQSRDFIYVSDVVDAIVKCIELKVDRTVHILDICSGRLTSLIKTIHIIQKESQRKATILFLPIVNESKGIKRNIQKTKDLLGWAPKISVKDGLRKIIKNYEYKN